MRKRRRAGGRGGEEREGRGMGGEWVTRNWYHCLCYREVEKREEAGGRDGMAR